MSMFNVRKGGKKSFRKKVVVTDEEDDEEKQTATPAEVISSAPVRSVGTKGSSLSSKSSSVSKAGGILSFISDEGEEEEKDVFKIKKKKDHSRRLAKMMAREKKKEQKMLNSASTISKLKSEENKTRSREVSDEEDGSNADSESSERILAGDDALEDQSQSQGFPNVRIGPGGIPDSSTVHAIRKHRELMRQIGQNVAPSIVKQPSSKGRDYIPLDKSARRNDSRLVREDDNDRSDNEDDGKEIVMSFGTGNKPTTQQQVITALEDVGSEEDDEETRRWEEEQISKGVKIIQSGTLQQDVDPYQFYSGNTQAAFVYRTGQAQYPQQLQSQSWMSGVPGDSLSRLPHKLAPVTLGSLKQRLLNQLTELKEVNSNHQQSLSSANEDLTTFTTDIEQFEEQTTTLACDYQFYQETRAYLRNLLGCLGEKNTEICALEEKVFGVWSGRTERLISRRHQDVLDLMEECSRIDGRDGGMRRERPN
jgi:GC-rich sequence DNA-binding factor